MYSQSITREEFNEMMRFQPKVQAIIPPLYNFAQIAHNKQDLDEIIKAVEEAIKTCDCFHCVHLKRKPFLIGLDLYYRVIMLSIYGFNLQDCLN